MKCLDEFNKDVISILAEQLTDECTATCPLYR